MRLFIALPLNETVTSALGDIIENLKHANDPVRWVEPGNIHLTVRFLGDTAPNLVERLKSAVTEAARSHHAIPNRITRLGAFPNLRRARVLWAGLDQGKDELTRLSEHIEQAVRRIGFKPDDKSFKPHLTLGRVKRDNSLYRLPGLIEQYSFEPIELTFDSLTLYKSTLTSQGPIYESLLTETLD